jgi:predicted small metal-binding protein
MTYDGADNTPDAVGDLECDCGYRSRGATLGDRVKDAQQHAREAHGIDVSAEQVLNESEGVNP